MDDGRGRVRHRLRHPTAAGTFEFSIAAEADGVAGSNRYSVTVEAPATGAVEVVALASNACALIADGSIKCSGRASERPSIPQDLKKVTTISGRGGSGAVSVVGISEAVQVAVGNHHSCSLLSDGDVRCWGRNTWGQSGNATNDDSNSTSRRRPWS